MLLEAWRGLVRGSARLIVRMQRICSLLLTPGPDLRWYHKNDVVAYLLEDFDERNDVDYKLLAEIYLQHSAVGVYPLLLRTSCPCDMKVIFVVPCPASVSHDQRPMSSLPFYKNLDAHLTFLPKWPSPCLMIG